MSTKEELQSALQAITDATTKLGTDIQTLASKIGTPGLSQADLDDTVTKLQAIGTQLTNLDATTVGETPA